MCTDFGFSATSVCWRFFPFSRQSHASDFSIATQDFESIDCALLQTEWYTRLRYADTTRLRHRAAQSDRSIMRYRANWAQSSRRRDPGWLERYASGGRRRRTWPATNRRNAGCGGDWWNERKGERCVECKWIGRETASVAEKEGMNRDV